MLKQASFLINATKGRIERESGDVRLKTQSQKNDVDNTELNRSCVFVFACEKVFLNKMTKFHSTSGHVSADSTFVNTIS